MRVIYVAGPYRAETTWGIECNTRAAEELALQVWQAGAVAICPHSNSRFFQGSAPDEAFVDGYLEVLREDWPAALDYLERARRASPDNPLILLNISRVNYELENYDKATQYYDRLVALDPDRADRFSYLAGTGSESRAADARLVDEVLYVDEEL